MSTNPYEAPQAVVADYEPVRVAGGQLGAPRRRPAGRGAAWFGEGWVLFRRAPGLWIGIFVVMAALLIAAGFVPLAGFIAQGVVTPVLWAGVMVGCAAQERGEPLQFAHLFAGFSVHTGQLVLAGVLYTVALLLVMLIAFVPTVGLAAGFAMFGGGEPAGLFESADGLLLFLLAMLVYMALAVPLMMAIWFAPALIVLDGVPAPAAMKLSFLGCLKNIVPFLIYGLVGLALAIAATVPLLLGWLVLGPLIYITSYVAYREIFFADAG